MSAEHGRKKLRGAVESWELELLRKVASAFRTEEPEELAAELAKKLLDLKKKRPRGIRHWEAYLAKFFYNKASNWIRDRRARDRRIVLPGTTDPDDATTVMDHAASPAEPDMDLRIAIEQVWAELDPDLRRLWEALIAEDANQLAVARRLGIHRNTVRLWIRRIRRILQIHGFLTEP